MGRATQVSRTAPRETNRPSGKRTVDWSNVSDDELLDLRLCELDLGIAGTDLERHINRLYAELEGCGIRFRPHFWLSNDWYTPDDVPGIAVPFYMGHPRLAQLERKQMLDVEGGTEEWCMRILRHEAGHAIDNAYRLRRRVRRQRLFGPSSQDYPEFYTPRPYSKSYVMHLEESYAQSHPDEDFAETFAVWMTPGSEWQKRYAGWPALKKLEYIGELMREIGPREPLVTTRRRVDPISSMRKTVRAHYRQKHEHYGVDDPLVYDRVLRRLFSDAPEFRRNPSAARFVARIRKEVRRRVAQWTGLYQYTINQVLDTIIARCRKLHLRLTMSEEQTALEFTIVVTVQTMNYLHSGQHRVWL